MVEFEYDETGPQPHRCNARVEDFIQVPDAMLSFNRFVSAPFHTRLDAFPDGLTSKGYFCRRYTQGKWEQKYHQHGG